MARSRSEAVADAIAGVEVEILEGGGTATVVVSVCQGPPRCFREGDHAVAAALAGCVWCERITVAPDGTKTVSKPGNA